LLIQEKQHLTESGIEKIIDLKNTMNRNSMFIIQYKIES
jgi:hypothetical protein